MEKPSMETRLATRLAVLETQAEHLRNRIKAEALTLAQAIESGASPQTIAHAAERIRNASDSLMQVWVAQIELGSLRD